MGLCLYIVKSRSSYLAFKVKYFKIASFCLVNGGWTEWVMTKECTIGVSSAPGWFLSYERYCTNPAPMYGGNDCYGPPQNFTSCPACEKHINFYLLV